MLDFDAVITDAVRRHWNSTPCDYNPAVSFKYMDEHRLESYPFLIEALDLPNDTGKVIMEIGIGSAQDACLSLARYKPAKYILVDISENTVEIARRHLKEHCDGLPYEVHCLDAGKLSTVFAPESIDRVRAVGSLHHMPHFETKVLGQIVNVLKPGGELVCMLYCRESARWLNEFRSDPALAQRCDGVDNPYTKVYASEEAITLLTSVGLKLRKSVWYAGGWNMFLYSVK